MPLTSVRRPAFAPLKRIHTGKTLPPASWRPYPRSSFYKPIPGTADGTAGTPTIHASSAAIITKVTGWGNPAQMRPGESSSSVGTTVDFGHPVYYASLTDPLFTIAKRTDGFNSDWWNTQIRIPQAALPTDGSDRHMMVVQPNGDQYDIWHLSSDAAGTLLSALPNGGGTVYGGGLGKYRVDGDDTDLGTLNPPGGAVAAKVPGLAGMIRPEEMYARWIGHALYMIVKSTDGTHVAPAQGNAAASDATNAPPCGARFQLNMTQTEINALADSGNSSGRWWNKAFLTALRVYGMYVCDTSGASWSCLMQSGFSWSSLTGTDAWRTWAANTSPAMTYFATDDVYLWDIRTLVTWSAKLRVLDWTDPLNH